MYETLRIVEKLKPKYVLWENVKNLLSDAHRHNFNKYLDKMKELGYRNYYSVLNAKDYGVPQNRERVFTLSIRADVLKETYYFPEAIKLTKRLKDILDADVDESYYLSVAQVGKVLSSSQSVNLNEINEDSCIRVGGLFDKADKQHQMGSVYDANGLSPTVDTMQGGYRQPMVVLEQEDGANCIQVGQLYGTDVEPNPQAGRIYSADGISPTLDTCSGGNRMPKVMCEPTIQCVDITQQVKVRKYNVDTEKLSKLLSDSKKKSGITNAELSKYLGLPLSQVEHYFRTDTYFAIPVPEIWYKLKAILNIDTDEFDKSIMTFEVRDGVFESGNRVYNTNGIAPTIDTNDGKKIFEYIEPEVSDDKGVVEKDLQGVCELNKSAKHQQDLIQDSDGLCRCIPAGTHGSTPHLLKTRVSNNPLRIRKLTPKECWRLMGFDDADFDKASKVNSNTQLYKQAGNSIVVNVLEAILSNLFDTGRKKTKKGIKLW